ncbi:MAG TPA: heparinase II/III family protein, partial [Balneolaceae bacterium]|nr:heparinase II/III family protein [Balneolaceae bacterium]
MDRRKFVKGMALIGLTGAYKLSPFKKAMDSDSFFSNFNVDEEQVKLLLTRLDLNKPGLGKVKSLKNNPEQAAAALLTYYRLRHSVKHPVDRQDKDKVQGHYASPKDLRTANNALKHIFVGQPDYPPHFCG